MRLTIRYTLFFLLVLALLMAYLNEKDNVQNERLKVTTLQEETELLSRIPDYNKKAEEFVIAMNGGEGEHEKLLTGVALEEYKTALDNSEGVQDAYIDTSLIDTTVHIAQTEIDKEQHFHSKVLYELDMSTVADNPDEGVIDQRVVTYIMEIDWSGDKIERYEITWFNDTLGLDSEVSQ
ncbi:hypothetical protein [Exiguobacterium sp. BG5(2022)]|uniref:hypothetical protein n=1 Tax=Exiguobacterium sp. BG5(2022) TaxID=2962595 RepID=UPI002882043C|nr:hypothetical protein [Exiguobacterium sp. BG5(2022)]MDT0193675.1 hypothetical protein [Exiguobacterium sp. BG5(2022)]